MSYKLHYLSAMGRAEVTRLLFALGEGDFEDLGLTKEQWMELKPKSTFGVFPDSDVNGEMLCQSRAVEYYVAKKLGRVGKTDTEQALCHMVADSVEDMLKPLAKSFRLDEEKKKEARENYCNNELPSYLENFENMLKKSTTGLFIGKEITWADLTLFQAATSITEFEYMDIDLDKFPRVRTLVDNVKANERIAEAMATRPKRTL